MMEPISLYISPELLKDAQDLSSPLLKVPEDAIIGKNNSYRWSERLQVTKLEVEKLKDSERYAFRLMFKVSAESPSALNRGRNTRFSGLFNPTVSGGESGDAFMSKITINRIDSFLRAVGYTFPEGERIDYGSLFSDQESPIVGREVNAVVTDQPDRKDASIRRQDVGNFTSVEA